MPFELLQVTAQYSNAVLVAIMPYLSDFAQKTGLPIPQPVIAAQVGHFGCSPRADHVGGRVILTNDYSFTFDRGAVLLYRSPLSYYSLQEPNRIPEFYGEIKIKKEEAVKIAHKTLTKLGYTDAELHLDHPPKVTPPPRSNGKQVARYFIEWLDPAEATIAGGIPTERVTVEVDASTGQIQMLGIQSKNARRPDPKLDVHPPVLESAPKSQPVGGGIQMQHVGKTYEAAFLAAILPQVSDFILKAGINAKTPITTNDVDMPHYECWSEKTEGVLVVLYLKTGDRFVYRHGQVIEFDAIDSDRWCAPNSHREDKSPEQFYGPVKVSEKEALAVVMKAVNQLGYPAQIPRLKKKPEIVPPRKDGTNYFARYFFNWWPDGGGMQIAVAEVDATTGKLKSFYINDRASTQLWREPPKISIAGEPESRPLVNMLFGNVTNIATIQNATNVQAYRILPVADPKKPAKKSIIGYPVVSGPVKVSSTTAEALKKVWLSESSYTDGVYACEFSPGMVLSFIRDKEQIDLVVCLSCGEVRVLKNNALVGNIFFTPARNKVLELAKQIFPKDKQLQKMKAE